MCGLQRRVRGALGQSSERSREEASTEGRRRAREAGGAAVKRQRERQALRGSLRAVATTAGDCKAQGVEYCQRWSSETGGSRIPARRTPDGAVSERVHGLQRRVRAGTAPRASECVVCRGECGLERRRERACVVCRGECGGAPRSAGAHRLVLGGCRLFTGYSQATRATFAGKAAAVAAIRASVARRL
jgi:hypothetical protein